MPEVKLNIADIILGLETACENVASLLRQYYRGFITDAAPMARIRVDWNGPEVLVWPDIEVPVKPRGILVDDVHSFEWDLFTGEYRTGTTEGKCTVESIAGLEYFLWSLLSVLLPLNEGLLVHAASVSDGARAYVFPAPSGTGKSTLIRNSRSHSVLSDEGTLLRVIDGALYAYGSCFRSDNYADFAYAKVPVGGIYYLRQAPINQIEALPKADQFLRLRSETFIFSESPYIWTECFRSVDRVLSATPLSQLNLTNGPDFWGCLRDVMDGKASAGVSSTRK